MNPKISIIVIGYNIQNYIENCLNSVLFQTFDDYEVIFVNDGSKDHTLEMAYKFCDKIKIVDKTNGGIVSARKAGVKVAQGRFVTFVDGDDWVNTDFLKNLYMPLVDNPDLDIVCSNFFYQECDGTFRKEESNSLSLNSCDDYNFFEGIMLEKIDHHLFPKLYKREFILKAGYLDYPEVTMAEDWLTNAFFGLFKPNVFFSDSINYFYRFNKESVLRKGGNKLLEQIRTLDYMNQFLKQNCEFDYNLQMDYVWFAYVRFFLLENTESSVKREIVRTYKAKHIKYGDNEYCVDSIRCISKVAKLKLKIEIKIPNLIPIVDCIYDMARKIRDNYKQSSVRVLDQFDDSFIDLYSDKRIFLIGTSDRSNIGDQAIAMSEMKMLRDEFEEYSICEITGDTFRKRRQKLKTFIRENDIIFISGGGFLGDLWPEENDMVNAVLEDYPNNKIIILPQTMYFYDQVDSPLLRKKMEHYINHRKLYLTARDKRTYDLFSRYFEKQKIGLFPDMALYLDLDVNCNPSNEVMLCMRKDKERTLLKSDETEISKRINDRGLNVIYGSTLAKGKHNGDILLANRKNAIKSKLNEFSKCKFVVTDRLHGMILATLAGTPCIVFDNLSGKVSGVYKLWMKHFETILFCNNKNDIEILIDNILNMKHFRYSADYLEIERKNFITFIKNAIGEY